MILMGHNTDTTMMNSVEKVFITKDVGAHANGYKKQNNEDQYFKYEGHVNNPPLGPKGKTTSTDPPNNGKKDELDPRAMVDENPQTICQFCDSRKKLNLTDASETDFIFQQGQRKHFLQVRSSKIVKILEQCGYFMKLNMYVWKQVLKDLKWCPRCAKIHSELGDKFNENSLCKEVWKARLYVLNRLQ